MISLGPPPLYMPTVRAAISLECIQAGGRTALRQAGYSQRDVAFLITPERSVRFATERRRAPSLPRERSTCVDACRKDLGEIVKVLSRHAKILPRILRSRVVHYASA
jgi:hypothetical protein